MSTQTTERKIVSRIVSRGRGWTFSQRDFAELGSRSAIDTSLHRLAKSGRIRRTMHGIYHYPRYSRALNRHISPDIQQVAHAIARKFNWQIQPNGAAALNALGLSTQVPAQHLYLSDGPNRVYTIGNTRLEFRHVKPKESGFRLKESSIIVQGLKSLGKERITPAVIQAIRAWLEPRLRKAVLKDTQTVTSWIYAAIREICRES